MTTYPSHVDRRQVVADVLCLLGLAVGVVGAPAVYIWAGPAAGVAVGVAAIGLCAAGWAVGR